MTEQEVGVMQRRGHEPWGCRLLLEAGRGKGQILPGRLQKEPALLTPRLESSEIDFRILVSRTVR